jgi:glutamyl-tRNA reductase
MSNEALETFGSLLMTQVRDRTIREWDKMVEGQMKGMRADNVQKLLAAFDSEDREPLQLLIRKVVDATLHNLLWTLEQEKSVSIAVQTSSVLVPSLREVSDGLAGELYGKRGWIVRFSTQPYEPY